MMDKFPRCKKVVVTLRGTINANHNTWGGVLYDGNRLHESRRYDITDIVDRVGSGDSFMGVLIYGLLSFNEDDQKTLDFAIAASCLKLSLIHIWLEMCSANWLIFIFLEVCTQA